MTATSSSSGTLVAESPFFDVAGNTTYTITGDSLNFNSSGSSYFDIIFYNSSNTIVGDSAQNAINGIHDFSATDSNRNAHAIAVTSPSTAVKAKARYVCTSSGSATGFRQVKVERGGLPATPFSQETTVNYASAKWGVTVDANGNAAGIALMADSTGTSEFVVAANKFRVKKPDGTDGISWNGANSRLDISGDIYASSFTGNVIATNNINNNAVTLPISETRYDTVYGNGSYQNISSISFSLAEQSSILVIYNGAQGYGYGGVTTGNMIVIDGSTVTSRGGEAVIDYPTVFWSGEVSAGNHSVVLSWYGANSNVRTSTRTLAILVTKR